APSGTAAPSGADASGGGSLAGADAVKDASSAARGALWGGSPRLSAADIAALGNDGVFSSLFDLAGGASSVQDAYGSAVTEKMLGSILKELEGLKSGRASGAPDAPPQGGSLPEPAAVKQDAGAAAAKPVKNPAILRFVVNGYDVLATCREVYFSSRENDGTFLLTGDRKYLSDGRTRDETFYLLFHADGACGAAAGYDVQPAVVQDYPNEYSFLYQLAQRNGLKADKTGNLVSMRVNSADWNMDLLLDTGSGADNE
ncbi:MAG: hypothetical protein K2H09_01555, partial [Treponemataceae bacterium]|nr:hypothetical protein [Treponemataceae bacterium]